MINEPLNLTDKQRARVKMIQDKLAIAEKEGKKPEIYKKDERTGLEVQEHPTRIKVRKLSEKEKLAKWRATPHNPRPRIKMGKARFDTSDLRCMKCGSPVEIVTSTLCRMLAYFLKKEDIEYKEVLHGVWADVPVVKYIPRFKKGRICSNCITTTGLEVLHEDTDHAPSTEMVYRR